MKIFDYTEGKKGRLLDNQKISWCGPNGGVPEIGRCSFHINCGTMQNEIKPADYGVEAICFCIGEVQCGQDTYWDWNCVGSVEWASSLHQGVETK